MSKDFSEDKLIQVSSIGWLAIDAFDNIDGIDNI